MKKKVTLSLPVETIKKLEEISKNMVCQNQDWLTFLINQVSEKGTIY